jgi:hypothetical protein
MLPCDGSRFFQSFEVEERDQHFGRAEPNQRSEQQQIRSQNNLCACYIRVGLKRRRCRLYVIAVRFCFAECQPTGRTATSHGSAGASAADRCRCAERYSVGPKATSCLAARNQLLFAAKRCSASARVIYDRFASTEHHGRTSRREEHFGSDRGRARRCKEDVCSDFDAHNKGRCAAEFQCAGHNLVHSQRPRSRAACDAQKIGSRGKACGTDFA